MKRNLAFIFEPIDPKSAEVTAQLREKLFDKILYMLLIIGSAALIGGTLKCIFTHRWNTLAFYLFFYLTIIAMYFSKHKFKLEYRVKVGWVLFYLHTTAILIRFGLSGAGLLFFLTMNVLTTIMLGIRAGILSSLVTLATIAAVGLAMSLKWIPFDTSVWLNSLSFISWLQAVAVGALLFGLSVLGPGYLLQRLQRSLARERENSAILAKTNTELSLEIEARKAAEASRARLEQQLLQSQKMESVGRLAGGVAHDFNNLLTGITGNISLAMMDLTPGDPLQETLQEVDKAAQSAADLTRQLLAFSRKQIIEPRVIDVNDLLENMRKMLIRLIGEDIELQTISAPNVGRIKADLGQIEQVLVNLVVNARDAMPQGGKLYIETSNERPPRDFDPQEEGTAADNYVCLSITDTGQGMDAATLANIFDPFFTTKPSGEGTGLGLATAYGIVKQHGGTITVQSEPEQGSNFKLYFPAVQQQAENISRKTAFDTLPKGSEVVLVVEDEAIVRNIAIKLLKRQGYTVVQADSGGNALVLVEKRGLSLDLLMTDIVMPNMNGRELAEKLGESQPNLKVLYTSGYSENIIAQHGILETGLNFLAKPYTPQALAKAVRAAIDKQ